MPRGDGGAAGASVGAAALAGWLERTGKPGFDALWRGCGWGALTVVAICKGEVLPDEGLAEALACVTEGAVTIEMFGTPAQGVAA